MRIAFSTLGCPDFDWVDIYTMAKDFQFDGIEIRGIGRNIHAVTAAPFSPPPAAGRPALGLGRKGDTSRRLASAYPPQPNNAESESHWCVGYTRPRILNAFGL